jgi:hypothetical protein
VAQVRLRRLLPRAEFVQLPPLPPKVRRRRARLSAAVTRERQRGFRAFLEAALYLARQLRGTAATTSGVEDGQVRASVRGEGVGECRGGAPTVSGERHRSG